MSILSRNTVRQKRHHARALTCGGAVISKNENKINENVFISGKSGRNDAKIYWSFNRKTRARNGGAARRGGDLPYLIDSTDQSASFWSRRNHLDCNFLVGSPSGFLPSPHPKCRHIASFFISISVCGHFRNSLFRTIFIFFLLLSIFPNVLYFLSYFHSRSPPPMLNQRKKTNSII